MEGFRLMRAEMTLLDIVVHAIGRERGGGARLSGRVLATAALLTQGQLSAHICRAHVKQFTQFLVHSQTVKREEPGWLAGWLGGSPQNLRPDTRSQFCRLDLADHCERRHPENGKQKNASIGNS